MSEGCAADKFLKFPSAPSTARCPERSAGTQTAGRLLFAYFLLAKQEKVSRPPRRLSGIRAHQKYLLLDRAKTSISSVRTGWRVKASTGSARTGGEYGPNGRGIGSGRFRGRSTNSPCLRPALWVLRFAAQRNCDPTPKTSSTNGSQRNLIAIELIAACARYTGAISLFFLQTGTDQRAGMTRCVATLPINSSSQLAPQQLLPRPMQPHKQTRFTDPQTTAHRAR